MRVHLARDLLAAVSGEKDVLPVTLVVSGQVSPEVRNRIRDLPKGIFSFFNTYVSNDPQVIDDISNPTICDPNEIQFEISMKYLGRVARERLISLLPQMVSLWEIEAHVKVGALKLGESSTQLSKEDRPALYAGMDEIHRTMPVAGKTFVLGDDLADWHRQSLRSALIEMGGIVDGAASEDCDYFVSDSDTLTARAFQDGAKTAIDSVIVRVMIDRSTHSPANKV